MVRVKLKPEIGQKNQERLRYEIVSEPANKGEIVFSWEKLTVALPVISE